MKIKKSELLALIKEEVMSEMDGLTMMDDPNDDDAIPAGMEHGGTMEQVAEMMENAVLTSMDHLISMVSNFLVTTQSDRHPRELMRTGMEILHEAGFREPDASVVEKMIEDEMDSGHYDTTYYADGEGVAPMPTDDLLDIIKDIMMQDANMMPQDVAKEAMNVLIQKLRTNPMMEEAELQEGMDAESMQVVADAVQKMAPLLGAMSLPVLIGLIYEKLKEMGAK